MAVPNPARAYTTAQETGNHLQGTTREVVFALMHMVNMARALLEQCHATEKASI
ncbi:hypothetical protein [Pseudomonas mosselii]|uniref:DUF3077 domain-containing protein n=1 Tax=Pseudomonas mosselii TaxID=78327 RepID=A0A7W2JVH9_9PSED|nr:hypothetical protein [Pseudomonas mosselii]MBA6065926.1 hypothetical protein [Pseudomonas mosselii]